MGEIVSERDDLFLAEGVGDVSHRGLAAAGSNA